MILRVKLFIDPLNIIKSPNIAPILGQKGINVRNFLEKIKHYFVNVKIKLYFFCVVFILNKEILFLVIKRPSIYLLLKYFLKIDSFIDMEFNKIKDKIFPNIFNKIFLIKKKDINCINSCSFYKIFIGNLRSFGIKNVYY